MKHPPARPFAIQIDGSAAIIGDLHGQADQLERLIGKLCRAPGSPDRWLVFLGDFLDRGPDPRGALDAVIALRAARRRVTAVAGNHDFAVAAALGLIAMPAASNWATRWVNSYNSGSTFASYGVPFGDLKGLRAAMPESHRSVLAGLPWCVEHPEFLVVHAGLLPDVPYREQLASLRRPDFRHNRPPWLCDPLLAHSPVPADCPTVVVSGHVCVPRVTFGDRRILVDTTGGLGGELSAVLLPERVVVTSAADDDDSAVIDDASTALRARPHRPTPEGRKP